MFYCVTVKFTLQKKDILDFHITVMRMRVGRAILQGNILLNLAYVSCPLFF